MSLQADLPASRSTGRPLNFGLIHVDYATQRRRS
jgi:hypothetical protein